MSGIPDLDFSPVRNEGCMSRFTSATISSAVMGGIYGAVVSVWKDVPAVYNNKNAPAIAAVGRIMAANAGTFAAVGGLYAGMECMAETVRGEKDAWNGVVGGLAGGIGIGARMGSVPLGLAAGVSFAVMSAVVDSTGGKWQGDGLFDDGATPKPATFPYNKQG